MPEPHYLAHHTSSISPSRNQKTCGFSIWVYCLCFLKWRVLLQECVSMCHLVETMCLHGFFITLNPMMRLWDSTHPWQMYRDCYCFLSIFSKLKAWWNRLWVIREQVWPTLHFTNKYLHRKKMRDRTENLSLVWPNQGFPLVLSSMEYISDSILGGWCPNGNVQEHHRFKSEVSILTNPRRCTQASRRSANKLLAPSWNHQHPQSSHLAPQASLLYGHAWPPFSAPPKGDAPSSLFFYLLV